MQQVSSGTAYIFWCLCLVGICGGQRFYTGNIGIGLLYFFTVGFFGIGQVVDLALIPGMVDRRNIYLRGLYGSAVPASSSSTVTVNIGELPQLQQPQAAPPSLAPALSPMQKLLTAAKENGGQLSIAQAAMHTELAPELVKELLRDATEAGYAEINNDPTTGAIRYYFDL